MRIPNPYESYEFLWDMTQQWDDFVNEEKLGILKIQCNNDYLPQIK